MLMQFCPNYLLWRFFKENDFWNFHVHVVSKNYFHFFEIWWIVLYLCFFFFQFDVDKFSEVFTDLKWFEGKKAGRSEKEQIQGNSKKVSSRLLKVLTKGRNCWSDSLHHCVFFGNFSEQKGEHESVSVTWVFG